RKALPASHSAVSRPAKNPFSELFWRMQSPFAKHSHTRWAAEPLDCAMAFVRQCNVAEENSSNRIYPRGFQRVVRLETWLPSEHIAALSDSIQFLKRGPEADRAREIAMRRRRNLGG